MRSAVMKRFSVFANIIAAERKNHTFVSASSLLRAQTVVAAPNVPEQLWMFYYLVVIRTITVFKIGKKTLTFTSPQVFRKQQGQSASTISCLIIYIQIAYRNKYTIQQVPPVLRAFYEVDLEILADFLHVPNNECITRDKVAREFQDQLFQQIGQLKYEAKMNLQSSDDRVSSLSADLAHANAEKQILNEKIDFIQNEKRVLEERLQKMEQSTSWRVTKPLRFAGDTLRKINTRSDTSLTEKEDNCSRMK